MPKTQTYKKQKSSKQKKTATLPRGIRKLSSGRYQVRTQVRVNGQIVNHCTSFDTLAEATEHQLEQQLQKRRGQLTAPSRLTVQQFADDWHNRRTHLAASTIDGERRLLDRHVLPVIGNAALTTVTAADIERLMDNLTQCDDRVPKRQGQPLSTSMQKKVLGVLRQMFGKAYRQRLITFDPAAAAEIHFTRPDRDTQALTAWTEEEANRLYAVARSHHIGVAFCFALSTGMRIGEVLGLRLEHVDLKSGEVQISESLLSYRGHRLVTTPKTQHSTRTIYVTSDALAILREHKQRKSAARDAYPSRYEETDYVFTNQFGRSILPCTVYAVMARLCARAGVPYRGTHVQRRTYTSLQAQAGVGMDVISKQLGHSDPAFTARVYRTVFNTERKALTLDFSRPGKKKA